MYVIIQYESGVCPTRTELVDLYNSVGWSAYTADPASLEAAIEGSTFVVTARDGDKLVGLARGLSDDVSIFYLQDVLVHPDVQRHGVGRHLLGICLERFAHVRQRVLMTDNEAHQHRLYKAAGYNDIADLPDTPLHAFVNFKGQEPS